MMHGSGDANKVSLKAEELLLDTTSNLGYEYEYLRNS